MVKEHLSELKQTVSGRLGMEFPSYRDKELEAGINAAAREMGVKDPVSWVAEVLERKMTEREVKVLAKYLTIGETYFFRDMAGYRFLQQHILPDLINRRYRTTRDIRIWSVGCSTGEEAYSISIMLQETLADIDSWNVSILATDINTVSLSKATQGVYGRWSFRRTSDVIRDRYFRKTGKNNYSILPEIKQRVQFSYLNLFDHSYPSLWNGTNAIDIIWCQNVLMYFHPSRAHSVLDRLRHSLADDGWLTVTAVEQSMVPKQSFERIEECDAIFFRKRQVEHAIAESLLEPDKPKPAQSIAFEDKVIPSNEPIVATTDNVDLSLIDEQNYDEASVAYDKGDYDKTIEIVLEWLSVNPDDADAIELLVRSYANQGQVDIALEWCDRGIFQNKLDPNLYYLKAAIQQERGMLAEAEHSFGKTLYLDPDHVLAYVSLGNLYKQQELQSKTKRCYSNALSVLSARDPNDLVRETDGLTVEKMTEIIQELDGI